MPLTPGAEARLEAECQRIADEIVAAMKEIDEQAGSIDPNGYDADRILAALRLSKGLPTR